MLASGSGLKSPGAGELCTAMDLYNCTSDGPDWD